MRFHNCPFEKSFCGHAFLFACGFHSSIFFFCEVDFKIYHRSGNGVKGSSHAGLIVGGERVLHHLWRGHAHASGSEVQRVNLFPGQVQQNLAHLPGGRGVVGFVNHGVKSEVLLRLALIIANFIFLSTIKTQIFFAFCFTAGRKARIIHGMTNEELKAAIKAKGYTLKAFAEVLGVSYDAFRQSLASSKPLTEQLRRHIMLALQVSPDAARGERVPVPVALSLPPEVWQGIDAAAEARGISSEKYTAQLCQQLARNIAQGLILGRPGEDK